jgi:hypothetical protein
MSNRRFLVLALVITAFAALVIATSMGGGASGSHAMPDGQTMDGDMR